MDFAGGAVGGLEGSVGGVKVEVWSVIGSAIFISGFAEVGGVDTY